MTDHSINDHLRPPRKGAPDPAWVVGTDGDGELIRDSWDAETPHLAVTGGTGSGKSTTIDSMLCQLMHNNHPDDLTVWIAEPKNHLQPYRDVAHVSRFMDAMTGPTTHQALAEWLADATDAMHKRYKAMSGHASKPPHFTEAAAASSGETDRLLFGRLLIVIEECANYLSARGVLPSTAAAYADIVEGITRIARAGRAVGVHLALVTQYPEEGLVPSSLPLQCRHIQMAPALHLDDPADAPLPHHRPKPGSGLYSGQYDAASASPFGRLELEHSERDAIIARLPHRYPK